MSDLDQRDPVTGRLLAPPRPVTYWGDPEDASKETKKVFRAYHMITLGMATLMMGAVLFFIIQAFLR
jgi:hypothetical protein